MARDELLTHFLPSLHCAVVVIVVNKIRYFVLDSGYLTYYVDQLDEPPYGKDRKGQICLAGYRIVHSGTQGKGEMQDACYHWLVLLGILVLLSEMRSALQQLSALSGCTLRWEKQDFLHHAIHCLTPTIFCLLPHSLLGLFCAPLLCSGGRDGRRGGSGVPVPYSAGPDGPLLPGMIQEGAGLSWILLFLLLNIICVGTNMLLGFEFWIFDHCVAVNTCVLTHVSISIVELY
jgi:hypothetical protein